MATSRLTARTIDYHKYRSLVIDRTGSSDDRERCDRDMTSFCDAVYKLYSHIERFNADNSALITGTRNGVTGSAYSTKLEGDDRVLLEKVCGWYKLILENKRVRSVDVKLRSGWWDGRTGNRDSMTAGKLKSSALRQTVIDKSLDYIRRHGVTWSSCNTSGHVTESDVDRILDGPGVYVLKHRDNHCFQFVGSTGGNTNLFAVFNDVLREAYDGLGATAVSAMLVTSLAHHWDFYAIPVTTSDSDTLLRILENDTILKHDSLWPYGLNTDLRVQTYFDLTQLRESCRRHCWPPVRDSDADDDVIGQQQPTIALLRQQLNDAMTSNGEYNDADDAFACRPSTDHQTHHKSASRRSTSMTSSSRQTGGTSSQRGCRDSGLASEETEKDGSVSSDSDGSLCSSLTATTVRTAINKARLIQDFLDDLPTVPVSPQPAPSSRPPAAERSLSVVARSRAAVASQGQGHGSTVRARSVSQCAGHRSIGSGSGKQAAAKQLHSSRHR